MGKRNLKPELHKTILAYNIFEKWRLDAVGPLPMKSKGKCYILTTIDYVSRWAETKVVKHITTKEVAKFVYEDICCKFGVPFELISDQGPRFQAERMDYLCNKLKIKHNYTTPYYLQCNAMNESFNGEVVKILSKVTKYQG